GQVEVIAEAEGQVASAGIEVMETRIRRVPNTNRKERIWVDREIPKGAQPHGNWQWAPSSARRGLTHANPPGSRTQSHGFANAAEAFRVEKGEVLFANVYLNALDPPSSVTLQWVDESGNGDHLALWEPDHTDASGPRPPGLVHMGPLPRVGEWVRLEVP